MAFDAEIQLLLLTILLRKNILTNMASAAEIKFNNNNVSNNSCISASKAISIQLLSHNSTKHIFQRYHKDRFSYIRSYTQKSYQIL